jgi:hypothetical protein
VAKIGKRVIYVAKNPRLSEVAELNYFCAILIYEMRLNKIIKGGIKYGSIKVNI